MIFFYCPECSEELEAEDSIKNLRMKCPACWKEIAVPEVGVKVPAGGKRGRAVEPVGEQTGFGLKIFIFTFIMALLGVGAFLGARALMKDREKQQQIKNACTACKGSGKQACATCKGEKTFACVNQECKGTGKVIHQTTGQETNCPDCAGTGRKPCGGCSGSGTYGCEKCQGTGQQ